MHPPTGVPESTLDTSTRSPTKEYPLTKHALTNVGLSYAPLGCCVFPFVSKLSWRFQYPLNPSIYHFHSPASDKELSSGSENHIKHIGFVISRRERAHCCHSSIFTSILNSSDTSYTLSSSTNPLHQTRSPFLPTSSLPPTASFLLSSPSHPRSPPTIHSFRPTPPQSPQIRRLRHGKTFQSRRPRPFIFPLFPSPSSNKQASAHDKPPEEPPRARNTLGKSLMHLFSPCGISNQSRTPLPLSHPSTFAYPRYIHTYIYLPTCSVYT